MQSFKETVEDFSRRSNKDTDKAAFYEITFTDADGKRSPKRFDRTEYSVRAKLLLNEMTANLDEYGQSITEQEKRQVLMELLEKLC